MADVVTAAADAPAAPTAQRRGPTAGRRWSRYRVEVRVLGVLRWVVIVGLMLFTLFPFYYMVLLSVRDLSALLQDPARLWPALSEFTVSTYREVLTSTGSGGQGFLRFIANSGLIALGTVAVTLAFAISGAYAIARLRFPGRRNISVLFLAVYLFPSILLAVPLFVFFTRIGLRGSLAALVLVYVSQTVAVAIYMLRNYFQTVPASIEEAAAVDGAGRFTILRRITLPLAMPAILSNALFVFMIAWNEFLFALLFLVEDRSRWTVSLGLSQLAGSIEIPTTVLMAGSVILTLPIVVLFFATERLLTGGLTAGAEKG
ncbi:carbohydrate ABC transporter permease [Geodermatophilus sp. TF02-6]|uniref:carbohydrate ABC transporter permease n=1 Tax=Geodermatophilus sp. TF02-6 TaxID=2250575 RepID=UPI000DEA5891|nr:carbohydrate ABC transporter permease [Geodermatophilus sp. TF02-6]RBY81632.1 carbohydrate ABC transporter permease [Geodermatophilus sp. TF02-6]